MHCVCESVMHSLVTGKPKVSPRTLRTNSETCALSCGCASVATTTLSKLAKGHCPLTHLVCKTSVRNNQSP